MKRSLIKENLFQVMIWTMVLTGACSCRKNVDNDGGNEPPPNGGEVVSDVAFWLTRGDKQALLQQQAVVLDFSTASNDYATIRVDSDAEYQGIDGFGYTLTGGSADLIHAMTESEQDRLLHELFAREGDAIGVNYLRISVGASDLSASLFTYNELPAGQTDMELAHFSIEKEMESLIPVLKKILAINPDIKIMGSPWTAPTWMKDNQSFRGGSLKPEYYDVYARYLVKYVQAMAAEGIRIDALTPQNEPLHPGNNPSMYMEAEDQATFIKSALGPAFQSAGLATKIIIYDHNADKPEYPLTILADADANPYIDGSAFHLYGGQISALSQVHEAFPDKHLYFTEQWVGGPGNFAEDLVWHVDNLIIGATRNWSRNVLEWNLAADPNYRPHTDQGGCTSCLGALTINGNDVIRNVAYYIIGHASKFVPDGSTRIASTLVGNLPNVAFKTPEGKVVLVVLNTSNEPRFFNIEYNGLRVAPRLEARAVGTFVWQGD